jgi:uncharacterized protein YdhG (YjbR/CyaY superfamily)
MEPGKRPGSFEEYIIAYPSSIQDRLQKIRSLVKKAAPDAEEKISYGMPAFTLQGMLLYFAAHTKHIGFYPFTTAIAAFREELSEYKTARGSIQFPNEKPLPVKLISQIIAFRVAENKMKAELKASSKKNGMKKRKR